MLKVKAKNRLPPHKNSQTQGVVKTKGNYLVGSSFFVVSEVGQETSTSQRQRTSFISGTKETKSRGDRCKIKLSQYKNSLSVFGRGKTKKKLFAQVENKRR
jgi:hypothetical protein